MPPKIGKYIQETLAERGSTHGDYTRDATCAIAIADLLLYHGLDLLDPVKRHALLMISFKMARIITGDANFKDHWHDIAGYAKLAEDRCEE